MTLIPLLFLSLGCSGADSAPPVLDELELHRQYLAACQEQTANFDACRAHCAQRSNPAERTDCFFQLAEAAPRWANGHPGMALNIAYSVCGSSPDFGAQCFRHALHEIAITCNLNGVAWMDDPTYNAGERWAPWQACVSRRVLQRMGMTCLPPARESYHNMWIADDAPLCGQ
jgi:hypothetical protein